MLELFNRGGDADADCACDPDGGGIIDATQCDGDLRTASACRQTAIEAASESTSRQLRVVQPGVEYVYDESAVTLLRTAGQFATLVREYDPQLADQTLTDPLAAARAADARPAPISDIAGETGFLDAARTIGTYESGLTPAIKPALADFRCDMTPPSDGNTRETVDITEYATATIYECADDGTGVYMLSPATAALSQPTLALLERAYEWLAENADNDRQGEIIKAIKTTTDGDRPERAPPLRILARILEKHTRGYGVIEDLFSDPLISDVYATGPAAENHLWIKRDGESLRTNVQLSQQGADTIASRLRRESGRSFSRAAPTLDASVELAGKSMRVTAVTEPATDGIGFAFRTGEATAFTLPRLVANGTIPAQAAGLLSLAVRRDVAALIAGSRGAGKTTLLGTLLWELPATTRTITIEDTPELPIKALQSYDRDVQPLHTTLDDGPGIPPVDALRTALRLGDSALVLGEVRGEEAAVLYEAMRVGASGATVLGTIHGDGGADVKQRVTADLSVPESSFASTDLLVTVETYQTATGDRARRVKRIEEVIGGEEVRFEPLFALEDGALRPTGRIDRGNSRLIETMTTTGESYAAVRSSVAERGTLLQTLADRGETTPGPVTTAYARQEGQRW